VEGRMGRDEERRNEMKEIGAAKGLTIRDWFAGKALSGLLSNPAVMQATAEFFKGDGGKAVSEIVKACFVHADAMLRARTGGRT